METCLIHPTIILVGVREENGDVSYRCALCDMNKSPTKALEDK